MTSHDDAEECLTPRQAYLAMYYFIDAYWQRGGQLDGSVRLLRHAVGPTADPSDESVLQTADPASWTDWLTAIETAESHGLPDHL
jgi:hypothetical protein